MKTEIIELLKKVYDKTPKEAIEYLRSQGIEISHDWKEQLDIIKRHNFTVAKVLAADVLQDIYDAVLRAVEQGTDFKEFKETISQIASDKGWTHPAGNNWRLDTVYRTNLQSAYMAGRYYQMKAVQDTFPYWRYIAVLDTRTRPEHASMHGKVIRADDPIWDMIYVPNGYNCRCRTMAVDDDYLKEKNIDLSTAEDVKDFKPDPGFNANPAKEWKPDLRHYSPVVRTALKKALEEGRK